ncbi:hypothetical protein GCM10010842_40330 [Deinococcus daejeonensis]|uniref:Uncharacterized protein n=1 Tax=Deinococcus daejeonensis TaxID=1007098 RepID=A0ABQ2JL82_9DEIO|nr:hypothetical protein GCM10010842_40330 [Deinococcus daejeonensis]
MDQVLFPGGLNQVEALIQLQDLLFGAVEKKRHAQIIWCCLEPLTSWGGVGGWSGVRSAAGVTVRTSPI